MTTNDDQYVPSEGDVRARYVLAGLPDRATPDQIARARDREVPEFDRFLARVRRDAAREALDGLAAEAREGIVNRETTWGHGQAIASAAETYRDTHCPEETP